MYCSHFGLHRPPFNNTPDPTFYYSTPDHEEALATLQYATLQRKGFVLVTGEIGAGKTLIARMFLRQMGRDAAVAVITHTNLTGRQLLAAICAEFDLHVPSDASNLQLTERLQSFLLEQFAQDRFAVVLLDEAQNLPNESFEEVRMLGNLEADDAKLLQVCILGQPELRDRFRHPGLKQLDQRLFRRFHLSALSREHTELYIHHRLSVAGAHRDDIFTAAALDAIYEASGGVPRVINLICDNAMLTAYGAGAAQVEADVIGRVVEQDLPREQDRLEEIAPVKEVPVAESVMASTAPAPEAVAEVPAAVSVERFAKAPVSLESQAARLVAPMAELPAPSQIPSMNKDVRPEPTGPAKTPNSDERTESRRARRHERHARYQRKIEAIKDHTVRTDEQVRTIARQAGTDHHELHNLDERTRRTQKEVAELGEEASRQWRSAQERIEACRQEIQVVLGDAVGQYRSMLRQFEELRQTASAPGDVVEQFRQSHASDMQRVVTQIGAQRDEFKQLIVELQDRWNETRSEITRLAGEAASSKDVNAVETRFQEQVGELMTRIDHHRQQISQMADLLKDHCVRTESQLQGMQTSQGQTRTELTEQLRQGLADAKGALRHRLNEQDERLRTLDRQVTERLAATGKVLQELESLTATDAAELGRFQKEQAATLADLVRRLDQQATELAGFRKQAAEETQQAAGQQVSVAEAFTKRLAVQEERLQHLRQRLVRHMAGTEQRLTALSERVADRQQVEHLQQNHSARIEELRRQCEVSLAEFQRFNQATSNAIREELVGGDARVRQQLETQMAGLRTDMAAGDEEGRRQLDAQAGELRGAMNAEDERTRQQLEAKIATLEKAQAAAAAELRAAHEAGDKVVRGECEARIADLRQAHAAAVANLRAALREDDEAVRIECHSRMDELAATQSSAAEELRQLVTAGDEQTRGQLAARVGELREAASSDDERLRQQFHEEVFRLDRTQAAAVTALRAAQEAGDDAVQQECHAKIADLQRAQVAAVANLRAAQEKADAVVRQACEAGMASLREAHATQAEALSLAIDAGRTELAEAFQADLTQVREDQQLLANDLRAAQVTGDEQLRRQHDADVTALREAHQGDIEQLRVEQAAQAVDVLRRIQANRSSIRKVVNGVVERFRTTQDRLNTLALTRVTHDQLAAVRTALEEESRILLGAIETQKEEMERRSEQVAGQLQQARADLEVLEGASARACDVAQLQKEQGEQNEHVLAALATQRRDLEALAGLANQRCDSLLARLDALPADIATHRQLDTLRQEHTEQLRGVRDELTARKLQLEQAIQHVGEHARQTRVALDTLAREAASAKAVEDLRQQHTRKLRELLDQVNADTARHEQNLNIVVKEVKHHDDRVRNLEEMERPRPIRIELTPRAGQQLGDVVEAAGQQHQQLGEATERAGAIAAHLHNASSHVQEVLQHWAANADRVQEQSEQLRSSAEVAGRILESMQRCHEALDRKLNSKRWQTELARGEKIADRIDQAIRKAESVVTQLQAALQDIEQCETTAQEWARRRKEAGQLTDNLSKLLIEAASVGKQFDQSLARRKQVLSAVARNTAKLMEVIESARDDDEQPRPTVTPLPADRPAAHAPRRINAGKRVDKIEWPSYRTCAASAG